MGAAKEYMLERQQENFEEKLGKILGISSKQLSDLQYDIIAPFADDNDTNFYYVVKFSSDSPHELLSKISRIEDDYVVYVSPWEIDDKTFTDSQ